MAEIPFLAARNPRALVEIVLGRPVEWSQISNPRQLVEDVLQTPYEQLFDPVHDSPVYLGFGRSEAGELTTRSPSFPSVDDRGGRDVDRYPALDLDAIAHLGDLKILTGGAVEELPVRSLVPSRAGGWTIEVGPGPLVRQEQLARLFPQEVLDRIWHELVIALGWTPDGGQWIDGGHFFDEAAEFFDPVQGGLADCWLIAAMSSVAWALPYTVAQRSRATGTANDQFTNLVEFVDPANGQTHSFEVTDQMLVWSGTSSPMYGHSSEAGEIWPAIVEKAYAMWRGNTTNDHPDLTVLNGGDPVGASAALTGRQPHYTATATTSASDLLKLVKSHSVSYRTVDPMTAWTYATGADSPDKVNYADANLVGWHAYSVLGWASGPQVFAHLDTTVLDPTRYRHYDLPTLARGPVDDPYLALELERLQDKLAIDLSTFLKRDYIVLRNPWGYCEATTGQLNGTIPMRDVSFWRSIDLGAVDGVFAIDVATFKKYFAGIGVAL